MRRKVEEIEFVPERPAGVLAWMARLSEAGDGWINLLPGVEGDAGEPEGVRRPPVFGAIFGAAQAPTTMVSWFPPPRGSGRHGGGGSGRGGEVTVGVVHPKGRNAVAQLGSMDVELPPGWRVRQDHNRRGLIVMAPSSSSDEEVLRWALRAGSALAAASLTGSWQARVFQPLPR